MLLGRSAALAGLVGQAFTTLPSPSYSTTGGDGTAITVSGATRPFWKARFTVMTWSLESTQVPPTSPVTHGFPLTGSEGNGFGQKGSTTNRGTLLLLAVACQRGFHNPTATTRASRTAPAYTHRHTLMGVSFACQTVWKGRSGDDGECREPARRRGPSGRQRRGRDAPAIHVIGDVEH